ncbi:hypothetical protein C8F04DRAFT_1193687 [Mycena alexandri]|uniref:Uncharacterized protein n=1 Tax=Mycena alexandri TaxID=1745969 RepID=A0AAD6SAP7_9AGAR|nr:hypothetical protein C8F04DRAFT_1193687 [Mycena alexandri]
MTDLQRTLGTELVPYGLNCMKHHRIEISEFGEEMTPNGKTYYFLPPLYIPTVKWVVVLAVHVQLILVQQGVGESVWCFTADGRAEDLTGKANFDPVNIANVENPGKKIGDPDIGDVQNALATAEDDDELPELLPCIAEAACFLCDHEVSLPKQWPSTGPHSHLTLFGVPKYIVLFYGAVYALPGRRPGLERGERYAFVDIFMPEQPVGRLSNGFVDGEAVERPLQRKCRTVILHWLLLECSESDVILINGIAQGYLSCIRERVSQSKRLEEKPSAALLSSARGPTNVPSVPHVPKEPAQTCPDHWNGAVHGICPDDQIALVKLHSAGPFSLTRERAVGFASAEIRLRSWWPEKFAANTWAAVTIAPVRTAQPADLPTHWSVYFPKKKLQESQ